VPVINKLSAPPAIERAWLSSPIQMISAPMAAAIDERKILDSRPGGNGHRKTAQLAWKKNPTDRVNEVSCQYNYTKLDYKSLY
jgi:hypothetical protein